MKRIFLIALATMLYAGVSNAQVQAKVEGNNLIQTPVIKTEAEVIGNAKPTGQKFITTTGDEYPVYKVGDAGKPFIVRKSSKTGSCYKQTITIEVK